MRITYKAFTKIMTVNDDDLNGILLINKPKGLTSHDVIDLIRKKFRIKKVGHAGTLDPMATGLLIVLIGKATKISQYMIELSKTYEGTMRLGEITDSHDAEGTVIERRPVNDINPDLVTELAKKFLGDQYQIPPMFSAKKVNGQKLYKLARNGQVVDRNPQAIHIFGFDIIDIRSAEIDFSVTCSKGTYVRTLANDFGEKLGCGAHLIRLCRTKIGDLSVENSLTMDEILNIGAEDLKKHILCPEEILL